jgi:type IV pilus secretin PilQ/predicted competence protein
MRRMISAGVAILAAVALAGPGLAHAADAPVQMKGVKVTERADGLDVVIETSGPVKYQAALIDGPDRIVIDMTGVYAAPKSRWTATPEPIREIRGSQWKPETARVVVELTRHAAYRIEEGASGLTVTVERAANVAAPKIDPPKLPPVMATMPRPEPKSETAAPAAPKLPVQKADVAKREMPQMDGPPKPGPVTGPVAGDTPGAAEVAARPAKPAVAKISVPDAAVADAPRPEPPRGDAVRIDPVKPPVQAVTPTKPEAPKAAAKGDPTAVAVPPAQPPPAEPVRVAQANPTTPPPPAPAPATNGSKLITLDFKDADVVNVLRLLAAEGGRNLAVGDDVKGKVSVALRNVTWDQALDTILEARGLQKVEKGGVIRVVSNEQLAKEREAQARAAEAKRKAEIEERTKTAEAQLKEHEAATKKREADLAASEAAARGPLVEDVIRLSYADPDDVAKTLQGILGIPPEGTMPILGAPVGVPMNPTVVGSGGGVPNPALGQLPTLNTPAQPIPWASQPLVSISQDVLAKGITIRANKATNSIFLRLYRSDMERIKKLVREYLDVPLPQVKIEARMEILDRTALESIGIQWGGGGVTNVGKPAVIGQGFGEPNTGGGIAPFNFSPSNQNFSPLSSLLPISGVTGLPAGGNLVNLPISALPNSSGVTPAAGLAFGIVGTNFNINLALQALATIGKTRTLARPEIVTVENNKAAISLGEELPYATVSSAGTQIQFKEALLKLEVTPTVIRDPEGPDTTKIKMIVLVENNSRGDVVNLGTSGSPPAINRRKAETLVLMKEGERLVIGGVTTSQNQNTIRKVPVFGDVPVLGWLFKQKETFEQGRELVVFVTPSVLKATVAAPTAGK